MIWIGGNHDDAAYFYELRCVTMRMKPISYFERSGRVEVRNRRYPTREILVHNRETLHIVQGLDIRTPRSWRPTPN